MVATGTAVTLIAITMLAIAVLTAATIYLLPPVLTPLDDEGRHA